MALLTPNALSPSDNYVVPWGSLLISQLLSSGVRIFVIAPGSRSTPLVAAVANHPLAQTYVHHDERGLGFFALGLAKAMKQPVTIIVTSGTALGNLYPAVMEAHHSEIPLIVLSGDRPPELRDCHANQTTDQIHFFGRYVRWFFDLPPQSSGAAPELASSVATSAVSFATGSKKGVVHINCMFREPFDISTLPETFTLTPKQAMHGTTLLSDKQLELIALQLSSASRGIVIASEYEEKNSIAKNCIELSRRRGWPILSSITSPFRTSFNAPNHIPFSELLVDSSLFTEVDCIFQIGSRTISKKIQNRLSSLNVPWIVLSETESRIDPSLKTTLQITADIDSSLQSIVRNVYTTDSIQWVSAWKRKGQKVANALLSHFNASTLSSEYAAIHLLNLTLTEPSTLFFGTSLPVRHAELCFYPKAFHKVFTSRGVSGIDGLIATSAGIAEGSELPSYAVIGDQSFLHDVSSLPLLSKITKPLFLLVINNGGGQIFSQLPIAKEPLAKQFFINAHTQKLAPLAEAFGITTKTASSLLELADALDAFSTTKKTVIVEFFSNPSTLSSEKKALELIGANACK